MMTNVWVCNRRLSVVSISRSFFWMFLSDDRLTCRPMGGLSLRRNLSATNGMGSVTHPPTSQASQSRWYTAGKSPCSGLFKNEAVGETTVFPQEPFLNGNSARGAELGNSDYDCQVGKMRRFYRYSLFLGSHPAWLTPGRKDHFWVPQLGRISLYTCKLILLEVEIRQHALLSRTERPPIITSVYGLAYLKKAFLSSPRRFSPNLFKNP